MKRLFGVRKDAPPPPTLQETTDQLDSRSNTLDEKIRKLDAELMRYKEQLKRTKGPAQNAVKQRAMRILKQKRMYENQRESLMNQQFNVEQVNFATQQMKDSVNTVQAMKMANKELKVQYKKFNIDDIENMQDEMADILDQSEEIQEALGRSYGVSDDIDEDELLGELDALEDEMLNETEGEAVPSYLQEKETPANVNALDNLPPVPMQQPAQTPASNVQVDEFGMPLVPNKPM